MTKLLVAFSGLADKALSAMRPHVPFTALNTVWRNIDKSGKSILDVGCGKGEPMKFINRHGQFFAVGLDIFEPYVKRCQSEEIYDDYILCDAREINVGDKSFDIVLCLEVLEHMERKEGLRLISELERVARRQVIISTPVGVYRQKAHDGNPHQEHKYFWSLREMRSFGYSVRGCGLRGVGNVPRGYSLHIKLLYLSAVAVWVLASPVAYFLPSLAGDMVCVKNLANSKAVA